MNFWCHALYAGSRPKNFLVCFQSGSGTWGFFWITFLMKLKLDWAKKFFITFMSHQSVMCALFPLLCNIFWVFVIHRHFFSCDEILVANYFHLKEFNCILSVFSVFSSNMSLKVCLKFKAAFALRNLYRIFNKTSQITFRSILYSKYNS